MTNDESQMTRDNRMRNSKKTRLATQFGTIWSFVLCHSFVIGHSCFVHFLLPAGCGIGPNYKRPAIDSPGNFRSASSTVSTESIANRPWWEIYRDDSLKGLIETALTNNYDLRIAVARMEQARAIAMQTHAQFLPQIGYDGEAARGKNSALGSPNPAAKGATGNSFLV